MFSKSEFLTGSGNRENDYTHTITENDVDDGGDNSTGEGEFVELLIVWGCTTTSTTFNRRHVWFP